MLKIEIASDVINQVTQALVHAKLELEQLHSHYLATKCSGGCPTLEYCAEIQRAIEALKGSN